MMHTVLGLSIGGNLHIGGLPPFLLTAVAMLGLIVYVLVAVDRIAH